MSYFNFLSCATCHGLGTDSLFQGLFHFPKTENLNFDYETPYFSIPQVSSQSSRLESFLSLFSEQWRSVAWSNFPSQDRWGLIFASTKGQIEDLIYEPHAPQSDPYNEILQSLQKQLPVPISRSLVVSNACTSSHGALALANTWLQQTDLDHVLVVAGDLIGPFTLKGFQALRALSPSLRVKPFDAQRDGLLLGDGIATAILSREALCEDPTELVAIANLCEGVSATRPDTTGVNLAKCFQATDLDQDLILTHGTATLYNDLTEANAIQRAFSQHPPRVTASKWSVGHTLGASGLIDLCLAYEIHRQKKIPGILTLQESDLPIAECLVTQAIEAEVNKVIISSLGFGGMCSALDVRWQGDL